MHSATVALAIITLHTTVIDMHNYGGGDLVDIKFNDNEKSELFLFTNDIVEVNIEKNFLVLEIPSFVGGQKEQENV